MALKAGPAAGPRNGGGPVNVLVGSGASGHDFENKVIPGEWGKRKNYQDVKLCSGGQRHIQRLVVCQFSRLSGNEGVLEVVSRRAIVHQQLYGVAAVSEATPPEDWPAQTLTAHIYNAWWLSSLSRYLGTTGPSKYCSVPTCHCSPAHLRSRRHFGGITTAEDGLALTAGPAASPRNGSDSIIMLVDTGTSRHYVLRRPQHSQGVGRNWNTTRC